MATHMKKYFLLITIAWLHTGMSIYAQEKISVSYKNVTLRAALRDILMKVGVSYLIEDRCLQHTTPVTVTADSATLDEVLKILFTGQPIDYVLASDFIAIVPRNINGIVTDTAGRPIMGVIVQSDRQFT